MFHLKIYSSLSIFFMAIDREYEDSKTMTNIQQGLKSNRRELWEK